MTDYTPIACGFHDRLESLAVRRQPVEIVWHEDGTEHRAVARIADVFARDGADWVRLDADVLIRADRLVSVDGVALPPAC